MCKWNHSFKNFVGYQHPTKKILRKNLLLKFYLTPKFPKLRYCFQLTAFSLLCLSTAFFAINITVWDCGIGRCSVHDGPMGPDLYGAPVSGDSWPLHGSNGKSWRRLGQPTSYASWFGANSLLCWPAGQHEWQGRGHSPWELVGELFWWHRTQRLEWKWGHFGPVHADQAAGQVCPVLGIWRHPHYK